MVQGEGKKIWLFPDGELPIPDRNLKIIAHEALMVLNTSNKEANLKLSLYFEGKEPIEGIPIKIEPRRVKCIRFDHPSEINGVKIPFNTQYALRVESDIEITATFGRLDTSSERNAFYTSAYFCY